MGMQRLTIIIMLVLTNLLTSVAQAAITRAANAEPTKSIAVTLSVQQIDDVKDAGWLGDNVYFVITEFSGGQHGRQYTIPTYPAHWPAKALKKVHHLPIWQGQVAPTQTVHLSIELIKSNAPPFHIDDLLGAVKLNLTDAGGQLVGNWQAVYEIAMTEHNIVDTPEGKVDEFIFKNAGAVYVLHFQIKEQPLVASVVSPAL